MDYLMSQLTGEFEDPERARALAELYTNINPEAPLHVAYSNYMLSLLQGDLGRSVWFNEAVSDILAKALPWTVFVMGIALILNFTIGIALGAMMAYFEGSRFDYLTSTLAIAASSIPYYIFALGLLAIFAYRLRWFPIAGHVAPETTPWTINWILGVFHRAALPIVSVVLAGWAGISLAMRGNSINTLGADYLRVARLRGLSERRIGLFYVARNAILPLYTSFMVAIGSIFGGSIILETIFGYPGVGYYLIIAFNARDYILLMGAFNLITIAVVISLFIADITYGKIDPRAKGAGTRESY